MRSLLRKRTENADDRREQRLLESNRLEHKKFDSLNTEHNFIEAFSAAPSFLVFLWACLPLLLIASFNASAILAGVVATIINIMLLQIDTFDFVRAVLCTVTLLITLALYHFKFF
ncbi:MAG: hypothetical protein KAH22_03760 [Thiotrichaceae bacterium]|nr:hypothetical protein [Thiotrichaceae bacterium]